MRTFAILGLAAVLCLAAATASAGTIHEIDYAGYDATMTDTKGITTEVTDFAFWTGPNILVARRGDAKVEIPFRKIRSLSISKYIPAKGHSPATVVTTKGKSYKLQIERFEGRRYMGAKTDFGSLRIQLMQISKLSLKRLSHTDRSSADRSGRE
jgi:hypothetical protein